MTTKVRKFLSAAFRSFVIFSYFVASIAAAATPDELRRGINARAQELAALNAQIKTAQDQLEDIEGQKSTLQKELKKIDYTVSQLNLGIKASEITLEKLRLEIDTLDLNITDTETNIDERKQTTTLLIRELYERSRESSLALFLKNRTLAQSFAAAESALRISDTLAAEVGRLKELAIELKTAVAEKNEKKLSIETENRTLKARRSIAAEQKGEREQVLAETKNQEKRYQNQLSDLERRQDEIGKEIDDLEQELRKRFDPSLLPAKRSGVLAYPTAAPRIMTQEYGYTAFARRAYKTQFHNGVDFGVPIGTPVFASADGRVTEVGNNGRLQYGRYVLIEHDNNLTTLYAHLSRSATAKGAIIKRGEIIGYSGATGYAFGPHVHLTVYWAPSVLLKTFPGAGVVPVGVTIDPNNYL